MFNIKDHGGQFYGSSKSDGIDKPIEMKLLGTLTNNGGDYFSGKTGMQVKKILRSKDETDLFVSMNNNDILKYDSKTKTFGYYSTLSELASKDAYMYRKFSLHNNRNESTMYRLDDDCIVVLDGSNGYHIYDDNYIKSLTWTNPNSVTAYTPFSIYRTWLDEVESDGEVVGLINWYHSSYGYSKPWLITNRGGGLKAINVQYTANYMPIPGSDYIYRDTGGSTVGMYNVWDGTAVTTGIPYSGSLPEPLSNRDYFVGSTSSSGTWYTNVSKYIPETKTLGNRTSDFSILDQTFSSRGLINGVTSTTIWMHSKMFRSNLYSKKIKPYIELRQLGSLLFLAKLDPSKGDMVLSKGLALPQYDGSMNLYLRPNDLYPNNVSNEKTMPMLFRVLSNSNVVGLYLYEVAINI